MSAPTITAPAPSTDAAQAPAKVRPVPAPPKKRRQTRPETPVTIAVTSLSADPKLAVLAAKLADAPEAKVPAQVDPMVKLVQWRDRVLGLLFDRYDVPDGGQLDLSQVDIVSNRGQQSRKLNPQE